MADLRCSFAGVKSPNPFWLASAPPTDKAYNVDRAFKAGWGGVVWKTLGEDGPPVVNVNGPRYGAAHSGAPTAACSVFNNIELITDPPISTVNLQRDEAKSSMKWPDRALIALHHGPLHRRTGLESTSWPLVEVDRLRRRSNSTSAVRTACPNAAWAAAVGQVPEYIEMVVRWCKQYTRGMPVITKLTPNITDIRNPLPARLSKRGGTDAVSPDQHDKLHRLGRPRSDFAPNPTVGGKGSPWRLLRPGGQADRAHAWSPRSPAIHETYAGVCRSRGIGGIDHMARRCGIHQRSAAGNGPGLHRGHDITASRSSRK